MKITRDTPSIIVLKQEGYFAIITGLIFSGVGFYLLLNQKDSKSLFLAPVFIICGLLPAIFLKFTTIVIDKVTSVISIVGVGLLGKKTQTINFNQVKEVSIEEYITTNTSNSGPRNRLNFNLVIYLNDGQGFPIAFDSPSVISVGGMPVGGFVRARNSIINIGNKVASFIGVPFVDRRPPTLKDVVSSISNVVQSNKLLGQENQSIRDPEVKEGEVVEE